MYTFLCRFINVTDLPRSLRLREKDTRARDDTDVGKPVYSAMDMVSSIRAIPSGHAMQYA